MNIIDNSFWLNLITKIFVFVYPGQQAAETTHVYALTCGKHF